jgi:hypothetical protein
MQWTSRVTAAASRASEDMFEEALVLLAALVLPLLPLDLDVRPAGVLTENWIIKPVPKTRRPFADPVS